MIGRPLEIGGVKNGEFSAASGVTYYGGSPCYVTSGGTLGVPVLDTGTTAFVGIFANSNLTDFAGQTVASAPATFYAGTLICRLTSGTTSLSASSYADALPYTSTDTWVAGDKLYVADTGLWTNTAPSSDAVPRGVVLAVGSTYLDVMFY